MSRNEVRSWRQLGRQAETAVGGDGTVESTQVQSWKGFSDSSSKTPGLANDKNVDSKQVRSWQSFAGGTKASSWLDDSPRRPAAASDSGSAASDAGTKTSLLLVAQRRRRSLNRANSTVEVRGNKCCRTPTRFLFGTAPDGARWVAGTNCLFKYVDATLRGIGQVYLTNNPWSGLLYLIAVTIGEPILGAACLVGALMSTATAMWAGLDGGAIASGLFGYNGCLTGIALALFHWPATGPYLWYQFLVVLAILLMSALSTFVTASVGAALVTNFNIVPLTFPFQVVTWTWLLVAQSSTNFPLGVRAGTPTLQLYELEPVDVNATTYDSITSSLAIFTGIAETFLCDKWYSGIVMLVGIAVCSPISGAMALLGSGIAVALAIGLGIDSNYIDAGLAGFNPALVAISVGGFFFVFNNARVFMLAVAGAISGTLATIALGNVFSVFGLSPLTFPFTVTVWLFCLLMGSMPNVMPVAIPALSTPEDHLKRVVLSKRIVKRFAALVRFSDHFAIFKNGSHAPRPEDLQRIERHFLPIILCSAAQRKDLASLRDIVASGGDVNAADYDGRTALHVACAQGQLAVVKYLLSRTKVKVNCVDKQGRTPLYDAILGLHAAVTMKMLSEGGKVLDVNASSQQKMALGAKLCHRVYARSNADVPADDGDCDTVDDVNSELLETRKPDQATRSAILDELGWWLEAGVPADISDYDGRTMAHIAACYDDVDVLRVVCDINPAAVLAAVDGSGSTCWDEAVKFNQHNAIEFLKATKSRVESSVNGELTDVRVESEADSHSTKPTGFRGKLNSVVPFDGANEAVAEESTKSTEDSTVLLPSLLCDAAASGDIAAIRHITESGAEHIRVDHHDYDMRTPLHLAVAEGHLEAVNLLLALGHEVNIVDRFGESPLWTAIRGGHVEVGRALIEAGALILKRQVEVAMYLCELAADDKSIEISAAVKLGCAVSAQDYDGRTALHVAADCSSENAVHCLLAFKASQSVKDRWGWTPLQSAKKHGSPTRISSLLVRNKWTSASRLVTASSWLRQGSKSSPTSASPTATNSDGPTEIVAFSSVENDED